jgi:putative ABC transport system ATP-binding protein
VVATLARMTAPATIVSATDVTRRYGEGDASVDALRGVSLDVQQGKLTAVMGPSGSGKSTLMHILAGLDKPTSGSVLVAGHEITTMKDNELTKLRREHIGFVFQFFNLLPMLNAGENVMLPLSVAGEKVDPAWFEELVGKVGLADRLGHRPAELDSKTGEEILNLLRDSADSYGQTIVMVTHDPRAAAIADRILYLADGLIVLDQKDATAAEVLQTMNELDTLAS